MKTKLSILFLLFWVSIAFGAAAPPTVTSTGASAILSYTATGNGNVTVDGGSTVKERGVVWNLAGTPTTADNKVTAGTGTGAFTAPLTGLTPQTKAYMRAYGINDTGTGYSSESNFYPEPDKIFRCYVTSTVVALTAFPECHALLGGKSYYITDYHWSRSAASAIAADFVAVQSGTTVTTDCDTATATLYSGYSLAFQPAGPGRFPRPLKVTAGHNLCFIQSLAGPPTTKMLLLGFVGSTAQAAEIRTSSAVDFNCVMSSTATALTMITGCDALTAGKSYYITSFNWTSSIISTTTNFMLLSAGTGANCVTTSVSLYAGFINAAFVPGGPGAFQTPIKAPANNMLCFIHPGAGTRKINVAGYVQ